MQLFLFEIFRNCFERLFESLDSPIDLFVCDHNWRFYTTGKSWIESARDEDSILEELSCDLISDLCRVKMLSNEKSFSWNWFIDFRIFFDKFFEMLHGIFSLFFCLFWIIISKCDMDRSNCSTTRKGSSTRCSRMDKRIWMHHTLPDFFCRDKCWDRHYATAKCLGHSHNIWNNSPVVYPPEFPCATNTSLYFVSNEEYSMLLGRSSDSWPEIIWWYDSPGFSLDWLHHNSSNPNSDCLTDLKLPLYCVSISEWYMIYWSSIEWSYRLTIILFPDHWEWPHSLSMKSFYCDDKSWFLRIHFCKFDCSLICFCSTSCKKCIFEISWSYVCEYLREYTTEWINELLRWHRSMEELCLYSRYNIRMRPAMTHHSKSSEPINIFSTENILKYCSFPLPFDCDAVTWNNATLICKCDTLSIIEPSFIEVFTKVIERFFYYPSSFIWCWILFCFDDFEPFLCIFENFIGIILHTNMGIRN